MQPDDLQNGCGSRTKKESLICVIEKQRGYCLNLRGEILEKMKKESFI